MSVMFRLISSKSFKSACNSFGPDGKNPLPHKHLCVWDFLCIFKGKVAPTIKKFWSQGPREGGVGMGGFW